MKARISPQQKSVSFYDEVLNGKYNQIETSNQQLIHETTAEQPDSNTEGGNTDHQMGNEGLNGLVDSAEADITGPDDQEAE